MIQQKNSCIILLHEIYGINEHILLYKRKYSDLGFDVLIPNLLNLTSPFSEEDDKLAYQNFSENYDWQALTQIVIRSIEKAKNEYESVIVIGFSIGATIAWLCASKVEVDQTICIYGSRIRKFTDLIPLNPVILIYGDEEKTVDIQQLKEMMSCNKYIEFKIIPGNHGFMNANHKHYNSPSKLEVDKIIMEKITAFI